MPTSYPDFGEQPWDSELKGYIDSADTEHQAAAAVAATVALDAHKISGDHDDRYYTKGQSDANYVTAAALDPYLTQTEADALYMGVGQANDFYTKTESDTLYQTEVETDLRYYTKVESDSLYVSQVEYDNVRPVGEVTMWFGAAPPSGWLVLDGSTFDAGIYPLLNTHLGGNVLPDFRDRFPIGASGTKAAKTFGGSATKAVPPHTHSTPDHTHTNNLSIAETALGLATNTTTGGTASRLSGDGDAAHGHGINGGITSSGAGTTGAAAGAAFDVMNPWMSLNFIIKAG